MLNNCIYKHFKPAIENGYDYTGQVLCGMEMGN